MKTTPNNVRSPYWTLNSPRSCCPRHSHGDYFVRLAHHLLRVEIRKKLLFCRVFEFTLDYLNVSALCTLLHLPGWCFCI